MSPDDQRAKDKIHTALSISEGKPTASNDVNGGGTLSPWWITNNQIHQNGSKRWNILYIYLAATYHA